MILTSENVRGHLSIRKLKCFSYTLKQSVLPDKIVNIFLICR